MLRAEPLPKSCPTFFTQIYKKSLQSSSATASLIILSLRRSTTPMAVSLPCDGWQVLGVGLKTGNLLMVLSSSTVSKK